MEEVEEIKRKRLAFFLTLLFHLILLIIFYFILAWAPPNPPHPKLGIELNFGFESEGQNNLPISNPNIENEEVVEPQPIENEDVEPINENITPTEEIVESINDDNNVVEKEKSKTPSKVQKENPEKEKLKDNKSEYNPTQGDTDKKEIQGDINQQALYEKEGGGQDGSNLKLAGWEWDAPPQPNDNSQETGKIVYEIVVDSDGYIISYRIITSTVSPAVSRLYSSAVENLTFYKTSSYRPAPSSKGTITFLIRSK